MIFFFFIIKYNKHENYPHPKKLIVVVHFIVYFRQIMPPHIHKTVFIQKVGGFFQEKSPH